MRHFNLFIPSVFSLLIVKVNMEVQKMNSGVSCVLDDVPPDPASPTASPRRLPSDTDDGDATAPEYFEAIISSDELGFTLHRDVSEGDTLYMQPSLLCAMCCVGDTFWEPFESDQSERGRLCTPGGRHRW